MNKFINLSDKMAIVLSVLCVLHCLAFPVFLIFLSTFFGVVAFDSEQVHIWLLFAVVPISLFAILAGYFHHRLISVFSIGLVGMAILVLAAVIGHDLLGHAAEIIMTLVGSALIAYAHFRNISLRRSKNTQGAVQPVS